MISFSKLFTAFVLPPGCVIAAVALCALFCGRRAVRNFLLGLAASLCLLSIGPVRDGLLLPLENRWHALDDSFIAPGDTDFVVVLGGGSVAASPEEGGRDSLSGHAFKRAAYGWRLASRYGLPLLFSGGKVFERGQDPEAAAAARLLEALGADGRRIVKETESRNTWQNAAMTAENFRAKKVILVTSAFHMPRSVWCFEKNGVKVIPAPTDYRVDRGTYFTFADFLPSMQALADSWTALHEYLGMLSYKLIY